MLKFVLGGSGSGKTTLLYQRVKARAEAGQRSILLVPEQFTSSTEGRIYRELGDSLSGLVESFSFTSLAEKILSTEGGAQMTARVAPTTTAKPGVKTKVIFDLTQCHLFDKETEIAINSYND